MSEPEKLRLAAEEARVKADEAASAGLLFFARALLDHATVYEHHANSLERILRQRRDKS